MNIITADLKKLKLTELSRYTGSQTEYTDVVEFGFDILQFLNEMHPGWYRAQTLGQEYSYPFDCANGSQFIIKAKIQEWGGIIVKFEYHRTIPPAVDPSLCYVDWQTSGSYNYDVSTLYNAIATGQLKCLLAVSPFNKTATDENIDNTAIIFFKGTSRIGNNSHWTTATGQIPQLLRAFFYGMEESGNPKFGPDSDEDGGFGDFNDGTDYITLPGVPGISALSAGFVNMYNPSPAQLQVLVNALWSNDISQVFWKMFTDPMESLVSLQIFPVAPVVTPASVNIVMGNVTLQDQSTTPITFALAPALTNQYKIIDCGSLKMNEYWGSALDYSPYTKAEIFLPYIGVKEIDINDVMAATLHLQYIVDFLTGTCTAQLECVKAQHIDFSAPLYHWQGNMAMAVPASASDMSQLVTSIASTLVSAGLTVATGGSGAVLASGIAGGALNMANAHPRIEKGGTVAMTAGALDNQTPFIILTRPIQSKPANFQGYKGWPSNITAEIGSLTGYTEIEYIHVEIDSATDEEKSEIERLLKEGVII